MVAQTSSAGGNRAPTGMRVKFELTIDVTFEPLHPPTEGRGCACHGDAPAPEPETARAATIEWQPKPGVKLGSVSADGRFEITQPAAGTHQFVACDLWTGERAIIYDRLPGAHDWCERRLPGFPLAWTDGRSGWGAERLGDRFRVTTIPGTALFEAVDCRLDVAHSLRRAKFETLAAGQRWCEVRAACEVDDEGERYGTFAALHYTAPPKNQS